MRERTGKGDWVGEASTGEISVWVREVRTGGNYIVGRGWAKLGCWGKGGKDGSVEGR